MKDSQIADLRAQILAEIAALSVQNVQNQDAAKPVTLDQQAFGRLARMDAMQGQAMAQATARRRGDRLAQLQAAMKRIEDGDYGRCAGCDEWVPLARLSLDPTVQLCVSCAVG